MKLFLFIILILVADYSKAQPIPACNDATKRLFIISQEKLMGYPLAKANPNTLDSTLKCFAIHDYQIKDSMGLTYFEIKINRTIQDFSKSTKGRKDMEEMKIMIGCQQKIAKETRFRDSFNLYLKIRAFKSGTYFIDVGKYKKSVKLKYRRLSDSIAVIDVTPPKWSRCDLVGNFNGNLYRQNKPIKGTRLNKGSGGDYLSSGVFYRVATLRKERRPNLKTGHFHILV